MNNNHEKYMKRCYELAVCAGKKGMTPLVPYWSVKVKLSQRRRIPQTMKKVFSDTLNLILCMHVQINSLIKFLKTRYFIPVVHLACVA